MHTGFPLLYHVKFSRDLICTQETEQGRFDTWIRHFEPLRFVDIFILRKLYMQ